MPIDNKSIQELISFRQYLHQHPELSGEEYETAKAIVDQVKKYEPDELIVGLGGTGVAVVYNGSEAGPTVMLRCELDALPIEEKNDFVYRSDKTIISHKCGHDGHMAIMVGMAKTLSLTKLRKGRVVLLFQPAEETGEGAVEVLKDDRFNTIKPDYVFALHNMPGYPLGTVILRKNHFAAASKGLTINLQGRTSHASEPEFGLNPALAISEIIKNLLSIAKKYQFKDLVLVTLVHACLGEKAFGVSPANGTVMATLRSYRDDDMQILTKLIHKLVEEIVSKEKLDYNISYSEEFPAVINDAASVMLIDKIADKENLEKLFLEEPIRWSEDFAHFTNLTPGALFGLGSGKDRPRLHDASYDFPDELIHKGIRVFNGIIQYLLR
ncbi:amidohydrolase [Fulvivirgaceae bacterium BMA10]|uniref:Amidohydrolase n=1 Tax=Splendidivirga corallicola TaxID=3051826 RepID=A0ABT8KV56_9BACT|nr:amidohydrolase [Fulvivirgaceae bacterium BMA10]